MDHRRGKVQPGIQHRHSQQPAGKHGAENSHRKKDEIQQRRRQKPQQRVAPGHRAYGGYLGQHRQQKDDHIAAQQHTHTGGKVGEKLGTALGGQAVQQPHAAAGHQIGIARHGHDHAEKERDPNGRLAFFGQNVGRGGQRLLCVGQLLQQHHRQDQDPDEGIAKANGPIVPQIAADKRFKVRCRGMHSQHLPFRR